ncbi:MAG: helix-turn-helix domain-containing protein [Planctomycetota bacterium]|nr:helix-turn-helix domain-containing protein [Planctomycetota bacterium]
MKIDKREMMSVKEVAEFLGVSVRTVWEQSARGEIPHPIKIGRKITRWHKATLEEWLKEKLALAEKERKKILGISKI